MRTDVELYDRRLIRANHHFIVESICTTCGLRMVGSFLKSLPQQEHEHTLQCESRERQFVVHAPAVH